MEPTQVLVDTCIWATYFSRPNSATRWVVDRLIRENRVVLVGPIIAEVLHGFRRDAQADWAASALRSLKYIELTWDEWCSAARLGREMAAKGQRLPLTDLVIADVAHKRGLSLYSTDPHFDLIPDLLRFEPAEGN